MGSKMRKGATGTVLAKVRRDGDKPALVGVLPGTSNQESLSLGEIRIREILVREGGREIAEILQQGDEKTGQLSDPAEDARTMET